MSVGSLWTFGLLRFWMGTGECANYSGAMKVVTRWFPEKERTLAVGVFNGGSMIGSILWQMAFMVPSLFGVVWVLCWRRIYCFPVSEERGAPGTPAHGSVSALASLRYRQTWALMLCRFLAGPVMQFFWYWMPDYLYNVRGMSLVAIGAFS